MKNLTEYTNDQLKNIASQLMIPTQETAQAKKATLISKIEDKAAELEMSIPEPEMSVAPREDKGSVDAPRRVQDYPRKKVIVESRDPQDKQKVFGLNTYQALVVFGTECNLPTPVIDYIKTLKETLHEVDREGNSVRRFAPRFFITEV